VRETRPVEREAGEQQWWRLERPARATIILLWCCGQLLLRRPQRNSRSFPPSSPPQLASCWPPLRLSMPACARPQSTCHGPPTVTVRCAQRRSARPPACDPRPIERDPGRPVGHEALSGRMGTIPLAIAVAATSRLQLWTPPARLSRLAASSSAAAHMPYVRAPARPPSRRHGS
jgi:hypothetical protein